MTNLAPLNDTVNDARKRFTQLLTTFTASTGTTVDIYHRYLSMQYHLTKGVQRYFLTAAAHEEMGKMRKLRRFLYDFANEEELHYLVAASDLNEMGLSPLPRPFDVELWHAYFTEQVVTRPFVRLGAATVLENLAGPDNRALIKKLLSASFLSAKNTKFFVLHMHETLPHGEQILEAIARENLSTRQLDELVEGARKGTILYLRALEWVLDNASIARIVDADRPSDISIQESERIKSFNMAELQ